MQKQTLRFHTLEAMVQFTKTLTGGYRMNTVTLCITATLAEKQISQAAQRFQARLVEGVKNGCA